MYVLKLLFHILVFFDALFAKIIEASLILSNKIIPVVGESKIHLNCIHRTREKLDKPSLLVEINLLESLSLHSRNDLNNLLLFKKSIVENTGSSLIINRNNRNSKTERLIINRRTFIRSKRDERKEYGDVLPRFSRQRSGSEKGQRD